MVEWPTLAQVMISQLVSLSPMVGSVLTVESLEPALDSVSPSLSAPPLLKLSLSLLKINIKKIGLECTHFSPHFLSSLSHCRASLRLPQFHTNSSLHAHLCAIVLYAGLCQVLFKNISKSFYLNSS